MLTNVMPQRGTFFQLLAAHTDRLVAGANAVTRLVASLDGTRDAPSQPSSTAAVLIHEVNTDEDSADTIKADFIRLLYESFTTPLNRDQLHTLILDLDRVLDTLQSVANAVAMYHVDDATHAMRTLAGLGADACLHLNRAVLALADRHRPQDVVTQCRAIDALDLQGNAAMRDEITALFAREGDEAAAWHAMKMRRFLVTQRAVLDGCRRAAKTIEEIIIENA